MSFKKFFFIIGFSIILVGLVLTVIYEDYSSNEEYSSLFSNIDKKIDDVTRIEIENNSNIIYIFKKNNKWILPSYEDYPASEDKIKNLLFAIMQLKVIDKKTNNVDLHKKLGLSFPLVNSSIRIRLLGKEKNLISDFIIGDTSSHNNDFSYIRKFDNDQTWLFKNVFDIKKNEIDWAENSLLKIARWRIKSVKIENTKNKDNHIFIYKDKYSDQSFKLSNIPKGFNLNPNFNLSAFSSLLESVKKTDIKKNTFNENNNIIKRLFFETFDGLIININALENEGSIYYFFDVSSDINIRKELDENESTVVGLPKILSFEEVRAEAIKYSYLKDWAFKLYEDFNSDTKFVLKDIIEEIKNN